jgi:hypothetical protein
VLVITVLKEEFSIDTRFVGRIIPSFDIAYLTINRKSTKFMNLENMIVTAGTNNIAIYTVDLKRDSIVLSASISSDIPIVGIESFNETTLLVFH